MKKEDVDKFRKELNDDIDKIIEDDESEKEYKPTSHSYIFSSISIICLIIVFGLLKGLCIFGFVTGCILFYVDKNELFDKPKKKENTDQILTEDEFEEAFK